jgi:hypothetical protein
MSQLEEFINEQERLVSYLPLIILDLMKLLI